MSNILNVLERPGVSILVFTNLQMGLSFSQSDSLSTVVPEGDSCTTVMSNSDQREMKLQNQSGSLSLSINV